MSSSYFYYLVVSFLVMMFLAIEPSSCKSPTDDLISKICSQTADVRFCNDIFYKHLPNPNANAVALTQITVTQSTLAASDISVLIDRLINSEPNKTVQDIFRICQAGYEVILNQFEMASMSFAQEDYKSVAFYESKAVRPANDCGNNVKKYLQLTFKNNQMKVLIQMAIVTVNLIGKRPLV